MTPAELYAAALRELRVVPLGDTAPTEYTDVAEDKYGSLYEMLLGKSLVSWTLTGDIPDYAEQPVTMMLAYLCAGSLGVSADRRAELAQLGALDLPQPSLAERQLRRQLAKKTVSYPQASDYY